MSKLCSAYFGRSFKSRRAAASDASVPGGEPVDEYGFAARRMAHPHTRDRNTARRRLLDNTSQLPPRMRVRAPMTSPSTNSYTSSHEYMNMSGVQSLAPSDCDTSTVASRTSRHVTFDVSLLPPETPPRPPLRLVRNESYRRSVGLTSDGGTPHRLRPPPDYRRAVNTQGSQHNNTGHDQKPLQRTTLPRVHNQQQPRHQQQQQENQQTRHPSRSTHGEQTEQPPTDGDASDSAPPPWHYPHTQTELDGCLEAASLAAPACLPMVVIRSHVTPHGPQTTIVRGQVVSALFKHGSWCYVRTPEDRTGYVPYMNLLAIGVVFSKDFSQQFPDDVTHRSLLAASDASEPQYAEVEDEAYSSKEHLYARLTDCLSNNSSPLSDIVTSDIVTSDIVTSDLLKKRFGGHKFSDDSSGIETDDNSTGYSNEVREAAYAQFSGVVQGGFTFAPKHSMGSRPVSSAGEPGEPGERAADKRHWDQCGDASVHEHMQERKLTKLKQSSDIRLQEKVFSPKHGDSFAIKSLELTPEKSGQCQAEDEKLTVLFDYAAENEFDLSVQQNELVTQLDDLDPDWVYVRLEDGTEGFIPKAYVINLRLLDLDPYDTKTTYL